LEQSWRNARGELIDYFRDRLCACKELFLIVFLFSVLITDLISNTNAQQEELSRPIITEAIPTNYTISPLDTQQTVSSYSIQVVTIGVETLNYPTESHFGESLSYDIQAVTHMANSSVYDLEFPASQNTPLATVTNASITLATNLLMPTHGISLGSTQRYVTNPSHATVEGKFVQERPSSVTHTFTVNQSTQAIKGYK
jgi:hypothetical protein